MEILTEKPENRESIPIEELQFKKFDFEHQLERQQIFLKYLNQLSIPLIVISLFHSMMLAVSLIFILLMIRFYCNLKLKFFEKLMLQKHITILAHEFKKNNPKLSEIISEMDDDQFIYTTSKIAELMHQKFETELQRRKREKLNENLQRKQLKVSFRKNSKANKISRSEKRIRAIVMAESSKS